MVSKEPATSTLDFEKFFQSKKRKAGFATPFKTSTVSITPKGGFAESFRKIADSVPKSGDETINDQIKEVNDNLRAVAQSLNKIYSSLIEEQKKKQKLVNTKKRKDKIEEGKEKSAKAEKLLEGGGALSKALKAPFKTVNKALGNPFEKIKNALLLLGIGWLTDKFVKAFQADRDGDKDLFEQLKSEITKGLAVLGGIFALGSLGVGALIAGIGKVGGFLAKWLIGKPLQFLIWKPLKFIGRKILERLGVIKKPPTAKPPQVTPKTPKAGGTNPKLTPGGTTPDGNVRGTKPKGPSGVGRSTFQLEQARKQATQANVQKPTGPKNPLDQLVRFFRGQLAKFETTNAGRTIGKAISWLKGNWAVKAAGKFTGGLTQKVIDAFDQVKKFLSPKGMGGFGKGLGNLLKKGGPIITTIFSVASIMNRAKSGMTPAQAILPELLRVILASGGAIAGSAVPVPGVNILTSIAGSFLGDWVGGKIMEWADAPEQSGIWKGSIFNGFNDAVRSLSESNELVGSLFPYDTGKQKQAPVAPAAPKMMSEQDFYNTRVMDGIEEEASIATMGASTYEEYKTKFTAANPSAAQEEPTRTITSSEVASTVEPKESESSVQASEMASQATTTRARQLQSAALEGEGQKVSVDISTVNIPPPAPAAPTPGGGGSGIPALKSFDGTNPYRLLSRSIYNVLS